MSDQEKENKVFSQELNRDDLKAAKGGTYDRDTCRNPANNDCVQQFYRQIYGGKGFPNCANTVHNGSICSWNDACWDEAIRYRGMEMCCLIDCNKSWM